MLNLEDFVGKVQEVTLTELSKFRLALRTVTTPDAAVSRYVIYVKHGSGEYPLHEEDTLKDAIKIFNNYLGIPALRLYIWRSIPSLTYSSPGMAFALAGSKGEAISRILAFASSSGFSEEEHKCLHSELMNSEPEVHTTSYGVALHGSE